VSQYRGLARPGKTREDSREKEASNAQYCGVQVTLYDTRQAEITSLLADVHEVYKYTGRDAVAKSYSIALEQATGQEQNAFAVSTLSSHRLLPTFPPNVHHYDAHDSPDSIINPVMQLKDSYARVQAHVARFDGDEHQEQRDLLLQQIEMLLKNSRRPHQRCTASPACESVRTLTSNLQLRSPSSSLAQTSQTRPVQSSS
jgi:hypothetical protein